MDTRFARFITGFPGRVAFPLSAYSGLEITGESVEDFVSVLMGDPTSSAATRIEDSLTGHLIAFAADRAMLEGRVVEVQP